MNNDPSVLDDRHSATSEPVAYVDNLLVNGTSLLVPLTELHPGQVRTLQHIADLAHRTGGFRVFCAGPLLRACVQFSAIRDVHSARLQVLKLRNQLIGLVNTMNPTLASGGGCKDIDATVRIAADTGAYLEIVVIVEVPYRSDVHVIDSVIAKLAPLIEQLTHGVRGRASIKDVADRHLLCAQVTIDPSTFSLDPASGHALAGRIVDLHNYTCIARDRGSARNADILATANSVLSAIDPASGSTGGRRKKWTARDEHGVPLAIWYRDHHGHLAGRICLPVLTEQTDHNGAAVDTDSAPAPAPADIAAISQCRQLLNSAVAAIGLAQSLANLHAHAADAIARGNPDQYAHDLALLVGARDSEIVRIVKTLTSAQSIRSDKAITALENLRGR